MDGGQLRQERLNLPAGYLAHYQLPADGLRPVLTTREDWLNMGDLVFAGDAQAVVAGYAPIAEPTAVELKAVLNAARAEAADVATADLDYQRTQAKLATHRPKLDALIEEVIALLRFAVRKFPPATQRRILRQYGVVFVYLPGEPQDEGEASGAGEIAINPAG